MSETENATPPPESSASQGAVPPPAGRPKMSGKGKLLLILFMLLSMGVLRTGFMFFLIGMLPSIIAYYMDVTRGRYHYKTILACNLTGILPYLAKLLAHGPSHSAIQQIMGSLDSWLSVYGAALMGLLLLKICPLVAQSVVASIAQTQIAAIERAQRKIENEWGPEVTQFSRPVEEHPPQIN